MKQLEAVNGLAMDIKMEGDYSQAIKLYKKAIKIAKEHNFMSLIGGIWRDIATSYQYMNELDKAEEVYEKALKLTKKHAWDEPKENPNYGITLTKYGYLKLKQGRLEEAASKIKKGQKVLKKAGHKFWLMTTNLHLAQVYIKKGEEKKAEEIINKEIEVCRENDWYYRQIQCYLLLLEIDSTQKKLISKFDKTLDKLDSEKVKTRFRKRLRDITKNQ